MPRKATTTTTSQSMRLCCVGRVLRSNTAKSCKALVDERESRGRAEGNEVEGLGSINTKGIERKSVRADNPGMREGGRMCFSLDS